MEDAVDRGQPFRLDELWRSSVFTIAATRDETFSLDLARLDHVDLAHHAAHQDGPFDFKPLQLDDPADEVTSELQQLEMGSPSTVAPIQELAHPEPSDDIWSLNANLPSSIKPSSYCTWEAFESRSDDGTKGPAYLAEAGIRAFDAVIAQLHPNGSDGVLPQDVSLRASCDLALGRPSIFFRWDAAKECFEQTLQDVPVSGLSLQCSASFTAELMDYASMYRRLLALCTSDVPGKTSASRALKRCIIEIMDAVESFISSRLRAMRTMLQLQVVMEKPRLLVTAFAEMIELVRDAQNEEEALSMISDRVHLIAESGSTLVGIMRTVLARVSIPWLRSVQDELGLSNKSLMTGLSADGGHSLDTRDSHSLLEGADTTDRPSSKLVGERDRRLIADTKASLSIARQHLEDTFDNSVSALIRVGPSTYDISDCNIVGDDVWSNEAAQTSCLKSLVDRMNHRPESAELVDELDSITNAMLQDSEEAPMSLVDALGLPLRFDPLADIRPAIQAQWQNLNCRILRHVFRRCELQKHLHLQHSFHLLGNADFVARLSTVLFSSDTQSAERTRDNVPTGAIMGLRLAARGGQRWPPASSELRLSLVGVLDEAYRSGLSEVSRADTDQTGLPGGLSFAIRELPDAEIDRVMDPTSLHALDFLRLQYTAPAPLDVVLTPAAMFRYDEIFRFLLQLLRVQYVTTRLRRDTISRDHNSAVDRSCLELHHVVSAIMAYVMDLCISAPWKAFMTAIDGLADVLLAEDGSSLTDDSTDMGLTGLRDLHNGCIDSMRGRLFLKRKQASIRSAVQDVLRSTLEVALTITEAQNRTLRPTKHDISQFTTSVKTLVTLLQQTVNKPSKSAATGDAAEHEAQALMVLLGQLNWNGFYDSDRATTYAAAT